MTTEPNFLSQFADEYFHLRMLTNKYDNGNFGLYRQISASLYRLLISEDGKFSSLLKLIGKDNLNFFGSERTFNAISGMSFGDNVSGLTVAGRLGDFTGLVIKQHLHDKEYRCKALFRESDISFVGKPFNDWLNCKVFKNGDLALTRREFIVRIAIEAGGFTHSDCPSKQVSAVQSSTPQGIFFDSKMGSTDISFVAESIREIAFEALLSMNGIANDVSDDTVIYKYIPAGYLLNILATHKFGLKRARSWKDQYEVFPLRNSTKHPENESTIDSIYASCWTTLEESDAMWGVYSNGTGFNSAIKVKSTVGKIRQIIKADKEKSREIDLIKRVDYMSKETMMAELRIAEQNGNPFHLTLMDSLYKKRVQFDHENEVRWVLYNDGDIGEILFIDIDPTDFFVSMELQPDLKPEDVKSIKDVIASLGYPIDFITQSDLYCAHANDSRNAQTR